MEYPYSYSRILCATVVYREGTGTESGAPNYRLEVEKCAKIRSTYWWPMTIQATRGLLLRLSWRIGSRAKQYTSFTTDGEAMAFLRKTGAYTEVPRPDLILLDLNMPKKDGREVLAEIKGDDTLSSSPVVVLTTSRSEEDIVQSYDLNANSYVVKPIDFEEFMASVKAIHSFWLKTATLPY